MWIVILANQQCRRFVTYHNGYRLCKQFPKSLRLALLVAWWVMSRLLGRTATLMACRMLERADPTQAPPGSLHMAARKACWTLMGQLPTTSRENLFAPLHLPLPHLPPLHFPLFHLLQPLTPTIHYQWMVPVSEVTRPVARARSESARNLIRRRAWRRGASGRRPCRLL